MKIYYTTFLSKAKPEHLLRAETLLASPCVSKETRFSFAEIHLSKYAFAAEFVKGKEVLDVASTWGYGSRFLFDKGAKKVVGGEISTDAVECAQLFWRREGTEFVVLNASTLPFADNSFEAIVSLETIEHLEQYEDFLSECKRVLKEGGLFICSTPYKELGVLGVSFKCLPEHIHEFYPDEFQELLSQYFTEVMLYGQEYWQKGERTRWRIRFEIQNALKHLPPVYRLVESLYFRFIRRDRYIQFTQTTAWDKILTGQYKASPYIVGSSPIPKGIIAVARK